MKLLTLLFYLTLSACAQMAGDKSAAVVPMNANDQSYSTQCNGVLDSWDNCGKRANTTCPKGWGLIDRVERSGAKRTLMFKCF
jgi:hypothetical protein